MQHYGLYYDTTGVDTARVRRELDYENTEVEFPESLAAVDIGIMDSGVVIAVLGVDIASWVQVHLS